MSNVSTPTGGRDATDNGASEPSQQNCSSRSAKSEPARRAPGLTSERADRLMSRTAFDTPAGWSDAADMIVAVCDEAKSDATWLLKEVGAFTGSPKKDAARLADVLIAFKIIKRVVDGLGMGDEFRDLLDLLDLKKGAGREVIALFHQAHAHVAETAPGMMLVRALSSLLASGGAHVAGATNPEVPPVPGTDDEAARVNLGLGWSDATSSGAASRPNGPRIGTVLEKDGEWIILFEVKDALAAVRASCPQLAGQRRVKATGWAAIWDEGLNAAGVPRQTTAGNAVRLGLGSGYKRQRWYGVPVAAETILSPGAQRDHD